MDVGTSVNQVDNVSNVLAAIATACHPIDDPDEAGREAKRFVESLIGQTKNGE